MPISQSPHFQQLFRKLLVVDLEKQLPGLGTSEPVAVSGDDLRRLLGYASILATSSIESSRAAAYETATRIAEIAGMNESNFVPAVDVILSRLGNFPGRSLLRVRYTPESDGAPTAPAILALERIVREIENAVTSPDGSDTSLTDFQFDLFTALNKYKSVSVSAPTSAGKSFVLGLDLIRRIQEDAPASIVYLVPTRALIREVSHQARKHLQSADLSHVPVRTVPFPIDTNRRSKGVVYVLTQERLMSLLHNHGAESSITTLIVDEAQGVQDDSRGIILQSAVEAVTKQFPDANVHFASPLASNPEYLQALFNLEDGHSFIDVVSPVSQNLILVSEVFKKPSQAKFEILFNQERIDLGIRNLTFKLRHGVYAQRAALARAVTKSDEATLLYANGASATESLAAALVEGLPEPSPIDMEIKLFIDFLSSEIHADYPLIKHLPYGVAFHYGYMPSIVRSQVEDLFKKGKINFVCCTATLLQGVNLPAKHIVIEDPHRGTGKPMERRDFLNLSGRAGRLLKEFHGNIWCLRPSDWEKPSYEGEPLQIIHTSIGDVMEDGGILIQRLLNDDLPSNDVDLAEAALGKIYNDFTVQGNSLTDSVYKTPYNEESLRLTSERCEALKITLPAEILDSNRSVRPDRLQNLYEYLQSQSDPLSLLPLPPGAADSSHRLTQIIELLQKHLRGVDTEQNASYRFYSWLAGKWIYNTPLRRIISERITFLRDKNDSTSVSNIIRNLLGTLETEIRFRLVKYYMSYASILSLVLVEKGHLELSENIEPYHVYLECGATNRVALNLIALGLSRVTALAMCEKFSIPEDATPEDLLGELSRMDLGSLAIPDLCILEIRDIIGQ